jgi:hypothetical protein
MPYSNYDLGGQMLNMYRDNNVTTVVVLAEDDECKRKRIENSRQAAQAAQEWDKTIAPYMATINGFGVPPQVAARELFAADHALRHGTPDQKMQMFQKIARDYGVPLEGLQNYQAPYVDPQVQALQQQLAQVTGYIQNQRTAQEQAEMQRLNNQIADFSKGKEHFDSLREDMAALLQAGRATTLDQAYEMASWANPTTRTAIIAKQQSDAAAEAKQKAQAAKKAASVNISRR